MLNIADLTGIWPTASKSKRAGRNGWIDHSVDDSRLHASLLDEFIGSGSLCTMATSVANALAERQYVRLFGSLHIYMPPEPIVFSAVASNLVPLTLDTNIVRDLRDYYAATQVAALRTMDSCRGLRPTRLVTSVDWLSLRKDWHFACRLAGMVKGERLLPRPEADAIPADRLLLMRNSADMASRGLWPSISADGSVVIPGLIDRRRDQRICIGREVWVECNAGRQPATLQDISAGGMGLAFCQGLKPGMPVTAVLADGRRLLGITVWASANRAGARFVTPLLAADPLLTSPPR